MRTLTVPEKHQLRIARDTLKMSCNGDSKMSTTDGSREGTEVLVLKYLLTTGSLCDTM
jgi:hypothetical protein